MVRTVALRGRLPNPGWGRWAVHGLIALRTPVGDCRNDARTPTRDRCRTSSCWSSPCPEGTGRTRRAPVGTACSARATRRRATDQQQLRSGQHAGASARSARPPCSWRPRKITNVAISSLRRAKAPVHDACPPRKSSMFFFFFFFFSGPLDRAICPTGRKNVRRRQSIREISGIDPATGLCIANRRAGVTARGGCRRALREPRRATEGAAAERR